MTQTVYAGFAELSTRVRGETLIQCLDFDRDGQVDPGPLASIVNPASTDIDMALATTAGIYPSAFVSPFPPALVELALDGMCWRLGAMYPTYYVIDHVALHKSVEQRLDKIRKGQMSLGQTPPEPSAIQGGGVYPAPGSANQPGPIFGGGKWGGVY